MCETDTDSDGCSNRPISQTDEISTTSHEPTQQTPQQTTEHRPELTGSSSCSSENPERTRSPECVPPPGPPDPEPLRVSQCVSHSAQDTLPHTHRCCIPLSGSLGQPFMSGLLPGHAHFQLVRSLPPLMAAGPLAPWLTGWPAELEAGSRAALQQDVLRLQELGPAAQVGLLDK